MNIDFRWILCVGGGLLGSVLVACSSQPLLPLPSKPKVSDAAPAASGELLQRLATLPDPQVVDEPRSKWGNGPVYTVWGKSYRVMETAKGFWQEGLASWYGTKFHGRRTSSGEPFDVYGLTAAHRHLPLPTYVRVTNLSNGKHSIVKVNDRGPFHSDRMIDLSYAAAVKLGFHEAGTAKVRIEVLEPQRDPQSFLLQAGAFRQFDHADKLHGDLTKLTGVPGVVVSADGWYRVRLGPLPLGDELSRVQQLLRAANYDKPQLIPAGG